MDRITIESISARGRHGWTSEERSTPQALTIDLMLELDLQPAGTSDDLSDTVDYAALRSRIVEGVETSSYALLEKLAASLLETLFEDARIRQASLRIAKPGMLDGATPSVTLQRDNPRARS